MIKPSLLIRRNMVSLLLLVLTLLHVSRPGATEENRRLGFGLQPGILQPQSDPKLLTKRIMSTTRYKLTPGDTYELVITIENTIRYPMILTEDYLLDIPFVGTLDVRGMLFSELKKTIIQRIKSKVPVQFVDFILTSPALFDIFIYGGVKAPGIATVNPLSRVSEAILLAQGLVKGASYRTIELIRGEAKRVVDLSRFAVLAELEQNPLLEPGDKVYIPQAERMVEIKGQVKYPGFYELLREETLEDLLVFSGGSTPDARTESIRISRLGNGASVQVLTVNAERAAELALQNGDRISVGSSLENSERIFVDAAVYGTPTSADKPATVPERNVVADLPYIPGLTLLALLKQMGGPTPLAELRRSYLQRESGEKIPVDVKELWETQRPELDIALQPKDLFVIPMKKLQVFVAGEVNNPGALPFANGYKVYDYILAAGGINVDRGNANQIYFVDEIGGRTRIDLEKDVDPGRLIYVGKNSWTITQKALTDVLVIVSFAAAVVGLTQGIVDLLKSF